MDRLGSVLAPIARVVQPSFTGLEGVPPERSLFVGNHTTFGLIDVPFMMAGLWREKEIVLRGLGDHGHYSIPVWRDLLEMSGMVRGTRENVRVLMGQGENVLVFPGGAGEVFKSRGEKYELKWRERLGFAKLALEFEYRIVPFAAIGAEEMFDLVADSRTPGVGQVSNLMRRLVGVSLPPIPRGVGITPLPRPERLYFWFGAPIETRGLGAADDERAARGLRDRVRSDVERGIDELLELRERDPRRGLVSRLVSSSDENSPPPAVPEERDRDAWFVVKAFEAWNAAGAEGAAAWMAPGVTLTDPPEWPDARTWKGRTEVAARLEQVTSRLGSSWAEVESAVSDGEGVRVSFGLHTASGVPPSHRFEATVRVESDSIASMRTATA